VTQTILTDFITVIHLYLKTAISIRHHTMDARTPILLDKQAEI